MGNFTKDLTIIDFVGILLPGCALLLILGGELGIQTFREEYLTFMGNISSSALFLVCGYVLGSLIHEACDWLERFLWSSTLFDPKAYAAYRVKSKPITEKIEREKLVDKANDNPNEDKSDFDWKTTVPQLIFLAFLLLWSGGLLFPHNWNGNQPLGVWIFLLIILCILMLFVALGLKSHSKMDFQQIGLIIEADSRIQTMIASKMSFTKRTLFNSFHVMMRNLLFVLLLTFGWHNGYPLDCYSKLLNLNDPWTGCAIAAIVFLMAVRSFHYAYLRYKYSYEDFLELLIDKSKSDCTSTTSDGNHNDNEKTQT